MKLAPNRTATNEKVNEPKSVRRTYDSCPRQTKYYVRFLIFSKIHPTPDGNYVL